jgi:hypothetical protein
MIFGLLLLIAAPGLLAFAYASYGIPERQLIAVRIFLAAMTVVAAIAVTTALTDLFLSPEAGTRRLVRLTGALSAFLLVAPSLISMLTAWHRRADE